MPFFRSYIVLSAALALSQNLFAQNLVPNGSFEDYSTCPGSYSRNPAEFRVDSWRSLTFGSPDYFNSCSEGEAAVPYNWAGVSDAYNGNGYAGIYTYMYYPKEYREYLHTKLTEPLLKDSLYHISFRYKLSSYSKYCIDRIGVLLSDSLATLRHDRPLKIEPTVSFVKDSALTPETGAWELAVTEYKASGNERFLTIGNFAGDRDTDVYRIQFRPAQEEMLAHSAYYYIDDVQVIPGFAERNELEQLPVFAGDDPELNRTYVLENIQFEFNSYSLLPESYYDLDRVVSYLKNHPDVSVELAGHTDSVGDDLYNMTLSSNRAASAADYLVSKGISKRRISARGYGEERPLAEGDDEQTHEVNRRVEIKFYR